jgi:STE24 endopeptidase
VVAGVHLWRTSVPGDLALPHLHAAEQFAPHALARAHSFYRFVLISSLLSQAALIAVLVVYARRGPRFARESAAGPIGTGFLLGMLGLALVWLTQLPFALADLWWARRHHVLRTGYGEWMVAHWLGLGGEFVYLCLALLVAMGLARLLRRSWWLPAAAVFAGIATLFAFTGPYLTPDLRTPRAAPLRADAQRIARAEGVGSVPLRIQKIHDVTNQPNAYSFGLGGSRRVVLWDTIVGFPRREVQVTVAHEYGHQAHGHIAKELGWFALLILPTALCVALFTRRRGGFGEPAAVPLALLVVVVLQLLLTPLQSAVSRRYEAEADWSALQTTHDPAAMKALMRRFTARALADPDPPGWYHALFEDHPTGLQRIEMAQAWSQRQAATTPSP